MKQAEKLAIALDAEDCVAARKLLTDTCEYEIRGELITGGDLIIASYQQNGEAGRGRFDQVIYESSVLRPFKY